MSLGQLEVVKRSSLWDQIVGQRSFSVGRPFSRSHNLQTSSDPIACCIVRKGVGRVEVNHIPSDQRWLLSFYDCFLKYFGIADSGE